MTRLAGIVGVVSLVVVGCGPSAPPYGPASGTLDGAQLDACSIVEGDARGFGLGDGTHYGEAYDLRASAGEVTLAARWAWNRATAPGTPPGTSPYWDDVTTRLTRDGAVDESCTATVTQGAGSWVLDVTCAADATRAEIYRCEDGR